MDKEHIIQKTKEHAKQMLEGEGSGHDWWHVYRVWKNALHINEHEQADAYIVQLAALLHDIADWKFHGGDEEAGPGAARAWLEHLGVAENDIAHVCAIIKTLSFKGAGVDTSMPTKEGMVVQDADRLDAIGAIGVARAFAYGGHAGRIMYDPDIAPKQHGSFEEYKKNINPTINHFYEKLLLLKGLMNTKTAARIAEERHAFMEQFLERFYQEWDGKK